MCLGEARTVRRLIRYRSRLDAAYMAMGDGAGDMADCRMMDMDEPIRCTYIDLDRLIESCGLDGRQEVVVTLLMHGYTCGDIAEMLGLRFEEVRVAYQDAVDKITAANDAHWRKAHAGEG